MRRLALSFVVPCHGREQLTAICLTQLRRTCDQLEAAGVKASVVVVACDENLTTARELGFVALKRDNRYLSRRFNDGIQRALDPRENRRPADYVVPFGSDDWADHRLFLDLPPADVMVGFPRITVVREDGRVCAVRDLTLQGGSGIRIYPARMMRAVRYRPADENRRRGCDRSILTNLARTTGHAFTVEHRHLHDHQIVDWKSPGQQLNSYESLSIYRAAHVADPFEVLAATYPADALKEMRDHYASKPVMAAVN